MSTPRVSIITPTYNQEQFIGPCIESALQQTFEDWELLVIDDGSTDRTGEVVKRYTDPRIRYFYKDNAGIFSLAQSYNLAISEARGEFIAILEGDDLWPPQKLAVQVPAFDEDDVVVVWGKGGHIDHEGMPIGEDAPVPANDHRFSNTPRGAILEHLLFYNYLTAVTVMVRRDVLKAIGGMQQPDGVPFVDYPTWLVLATQGAFRYVPEVSGYWRRHAGQTTVQREVAMIKGCRTCIDALQTRLASGATPPGMRPTLLPIALAWRTAQGLLAERQSRAARAHLLHALCAAPAPYNISAMKQFIRSFFP